MGNRTFRGNASRRQPFPDMCCWPDCEAETGPVDAPLCGRHLTVAYRIHKAASGLLDLEAAREAAEDHALSKALQRAGRPPLKRIRKTDGLVYFVRFGGLVKIGWTGRLDQRMKEVPNEEILGTVPGTMDDEKRCHIAFAHLRVKGEWFRPEPELMEFIADVVLAA